MCYIAFTKSGLIYASFVRFQNTYTNTDKLINAAEELARTGECDAEEIYLVAQELETVVNKFASRVQRRRRLVDSAVLFYTQEKQVRILFALIFLLPENLG